MHAAEEVLAQVEEAGPERAAIGARPPAHRGREAFEGPDEHGQLEVGRGDAVRRGRDARSREHGPPVDKLGVAGLAEPRPAFCQAGLELEQVPTERSFETRERRLNAIGRVPERGRAPVGRRRVGLAP